MSVGRIYNYDGNITGYKSVNFELIKREIILGGSHLIRWSFKESKGSERLSAGFLEKVNSHVVLPWKEMQATSRSWKSLWTTAGKKMRTSLMQTQKVKSATTNYVWRRHQLPTWKSPVFFSICLSRWASVCVCARARTRMHTRFHMDSGSE